jgi:hypothetical protein
MPDLALGLSSGRRLKVEPEIVFFLRSEEQGLGSAVEGF